MRLLLIALVSITVASAQTPRFQVLDNPVAYGAAPIDAIGDLDGDGDPDIVSRNGVFLNDGHGRFAATQTGALLFQRAATRIADVNGDGLNDVVSIDWVAGGMRVDLNVGGGNFVGPVAGLPVLPTSTSPINLVLGDVDGDGDADVMIGTLLAFFFGIPGPPVLWLNDGSGGFTPAPAGAIPAGAGFGGDWMFLRDLDADGDLDFVVGGYQTGFAILLNTGGTFTFGPSPWTGSNPTVVEIGELNGDGRPDLVLGGYSTAVILNSPTGFLAPVTTVTPPTMPGPSWAIVALDLDGDGIDELVEQAGSAGLYVRKVNAAGNVGAPLQSWPDLALAQGTGRETARDLDGDGDRDLVVNGAAEAVALMNGSTGSLVRLDGRATAVRIDGWLAARDVDGDGDLDLVGRLHTVANGTFLTSISTGLNDGNGRFAAGPTTQLGGSPLGAYDLLFSYHFFDYDGDGDADLYAARTSNTPIITGPPDQVMINNNGSFVPFTTVPNIGEASTFVAADFDADGDDDVVLGRRAGTGGNATGITSPMVYLQNVMPNGFAAPIPIGGNHATYDLDVGDFDGNGSLDVFQTNANIQAGTVGGPDPSVLYLNVGVGMSYVAIPQNGISGFFTAAGDLNGDGMTDLVVDNQVWFASAPGIFTTGPSLPVTLVGAPILADVDLDGDLDLIETPATVMINTGGAVFGPPQAYVPVAPITSAEIPRSALVDLDRDGDLDIVAPGPVVLVNTLRQIAQGSIPRPGRPVSVDLYGSPGGGWLLWASGAPASLPLPPWGTVLIDPAAAQLVATGTFAGPASPVAGAATFGMTTPNNPALVGTSVYCQSVDLAQTRLTNRITITVMGY